MSGRKSQLDILLAEDNPGDARLVEHHLNAPEAIHFVDSIDVSHVESLSAVEEMDTAEYDVLLLDLGLPNSTGLETLDRAVDIVDSLPIIVLTGMQNRKTAMESIERGAQDYLPKSELDGDRLLRTLRYAIERSRQQRALQRRTDQMEFFNSILRHDMLNGMNVIQARADLLAAELEGETEEYAETIARWSDDIIDLTKKVRAVLETLSTDETTDMKQRDLVEVIGTAARRARSKSRDASVDIDVGDISVAADELLDDVFANLLLNAIEHGGDDVDITVRATVNESVVQVCVADDGPGIDPKRRRRVFERGQKGSGSAGTGFGLYFVDSMVESYGGDIWIETSDRGGAEFVVELPQTE